MSRGSSHNLTDNAHGMALSVEDELVLSILGDLPFLVCCCCQFLVPFFTQKQRTLRESEIAVFQNLREEETLLVINARASVGGIHICEARETRGSTAVLVDGNEGVPDPFAVLILLGMSKINGQR